MFFSLRNSRIFDQQNYYPELKARVAGDVYLQEETGCYRNRYNLSSLGILSFERMVTDELPKQISRELSKPENDPYNRDYDDLDRYRKQYRTHDWFCSYVYRILLKGSLAYSVRDMESVIDEPFMKDVVKFAKEIRRVESFEGIWEEVISRITGINQSSYALKDLVLKQLIRQV